MRFGINFPQTAIGTDPAAIREFAQVADEGGFDYLSAFDHILGAHPDRFVGRKIGYDAPPYVHTDDFHEPLTLFAFIAGSTSRIELATSVLVLPQRQTALVAKQAAEVSILSGGRLRLGVGIGWNFAEFEALRENFSDRGRRCEEQIQVLRRLWTESLLSYQGRWHQLDRVAVSPRPAQPVPIWIGSRSSEMLLSRVARLADGWIPAAPGGSGLGPTDEAARTLARLRALLEEEGRDFGQFGLQVGIPRSGTPRDWVAAVSRWQTLGATHVSLRSYTPGDDLSPMSGLERALAVRNVLVQTFG